jgi:hypothetical protein
VIQRHVSTGGQDRHDCDNRIKGFDGLELILLPCYSSRPLNGQKNHAPFCMGRSAGNLWYADGDIVRSMPSKFASSERRSLPPQIKIKHDNLAKACPPEVSASLDLAQNLP